MGIRLKFKKKLPFHDLDIDYDLVAPITAIMGASGSGKSTLFQCISGLKRIDEGIIEFNNTSWDNTYSDIFVPTSARKVGYLFQNLALFPNMNVFNNIAFGLVAAKKTTPRNRTTSPQNKRLLKNIPSTILLRTKTIWRRETTRSNGTRHDYES